MQIRGTASEAISGYPLDGGGSELFPCLRGKVSDNMQGVPGDNK